MFGDHEDKDSVLYIRRPILWGIAALTVAICEGLAFWWAPAEWHVLRTAGLGFVAGVLCFFFVFANRVVLG